MNNITISRAELDKLITANYKYIVDQSKYYCRLCKVTANDAYEDLAHDYIIHLYDTLNYDPTLSHFRTYVNNSLPNFIKNQNRKEKHHLVFDEELNAADDEIDKLEAKIIIDTLCNQLTAVERSIIQLMLKDYSIRQIADQLRIPKSTVYEKISNIKKKFRTKHA